MADLDAVLATVRDRIARYRGRGIGEQDTKATLIVPILRALGWDVEDLEDVKLEYKRRPNDNPVDYALVLLRQPRLFIEAKSLGANLLDHKWANQFLSYAMAAGVEWVALTDGNEYRLYNSHATVPVEEKLFRTIRIADPDSRPAETLSLLSKSQLQDHLIDQYWKTEFVDRHVGATLRRLLSPEADPALVRLVHIRAQSLSRADVRASLGRLRATFDFPVVSAQTAATARLAAAAPPAAVPKPVGTVHAKAMGEGTPWRHVTLRQLIESGLLSVPQAISRRYRGSDLTARIVEAARIEFAGAAYDSLSTAGGMARKSVVGDTPGRPYPQTNGWTFWELRATDGSRRQIDTLRRELHERKVVRLPADRRTG